MLLSEAIQLFLSSRVHTVTRKTLVNNELYLRGLGTEYGALEIQLVTLAHLRLWRARLFETKARYVQHNRREPLAGGYSVYTLKGMIEACRQLFNWLVREEYLDKSPAKRLELPTLPDAAPRSITSGDIDKMVDAAGQGYSNFLSVRNRAILLMFRDTGCRLCGIAGLELPNLEMEVRRALVYEKGRGGKSKARYVFFKLDTAAALGEWLDLRPVQLPLPGEDRAGLDSLFVSERYPHRGLSESAIASVFLRLKKQAGIKGRCNPHSFRHALAKRMLTNGASLGQVSRILGHRDVRITDATYGVFVTAELQVAHEKYA